MLWHRRCGRWRAVAAALLSLLPAAAHAFDYAEHRNIACAAITQLCRQSHLEAEVENLICTAQCGLKPAKQVPSRPAWRPLACFGFADLVSLSGDHSALPEDVAEASCSDLATAARSFTRYLELASDNDAHFRPAADGRYHYWHDLALAKVFSGGQRRDVQALEEGLIYEAFSLHFLTDVFSAGHQRVDRRHTHDYLSKRQHDADCRCGSEGDGICGWDFENEYTHRRYRMVGDGFLADGRDHPEQWNAVVNAAASSICGVGQAWVAGLKRGNHPVPPEAEGLCEKVHVARKRAFPPITARQFTSAFRIGVETVGGVRLATPREAGLIGALVLEIPMLRLGSAPWLEVRLTYAPGALVTTPETRVALRSKFDLGLSLRGPSRRNEDVFLTVGYTYLPGDRHGPSVAFGSDYWVYLVFVGAQVGYGLMPLTSGESKYALELMFRAGAATPF